LAVTAQFPERTQALAGGTFNTLAQIGNSVGLAVTSLVAASVSAGVDKSREGINTEEVLWRGYKASFWMCFVWGIIGSLVCAGGLRGLGKVGLKAA